MTGEDNIKKIKLKENCFAIVDNEDYLFLSKFKWHYCAGYASRYLKKGEVGGASEKRKRIFMHSFIMNPPVGLEVDHINRDRLDNRKLNLRIVSRRENLLNKDYESIFRKRVLKDLKFCFPEWESDKYIYKIKRRKKIYYSFIFRSSTIGIKRFEKKLKTKEKAKQLREEYFKKEVFPRFYKMLSLKSHSAMI